MVILRLSIIRKLNQYIYTNDNYLAEDVLLQKTAYTCMI